MKEKLKYKKGITLIALIITIIVMIILVAVSVTVALQGELFTTAKTASNKTELEKDKELLMAAAIGALGENGKVEYANIQTPEGFTKESDGTYTKDGYTFIVDEYGTVTIDESAIDFDEIKAAVIANPETYLAKAEEAGQNIASNTDIGIGTDGEIVNLDLWTYYVHSGEKISLSDRGSGNAGYKGQIIDGKIQGTVPQYIYTNNEMLDVKSISGSVFYGYNMLETITIPETITNIGQGAFGNCSALTSIVIPNNVTEIMSYSFYGCNNITIEVDNTENAISGSPWGATNATVTWLR